MKALGVSSIAAALGGRISMDEAAYLTKRDSRHYAKRQMTWLRNNYNAEMVISEKLSESLYQKIFSFIR
ncbi:MAG: tRNA (adenosine(37)-N6)-dimethylallyltransferase MiaA, partial [Candidatus Puniceispirillum sp.]